VIPALSSTPSSYKILENTPNSPASSSSFLLHSVLLEQLLSNARKEEKLLGKVAFKAGILNMVVLG